MDILTIAEMVRRSSKFVEFIYCGCNCGKTRPRYDSRGIERKFIRFHNLKINIPWNYKNGRRHSKGYIFILKPEHREADINGAVREHRLVWEAAYNCCLLPWADVHHINDVKDDNRISNLQAMTHGEHATLSGTVDKSDRCCFLCGSITTYTRKNGWQMWYYYDLTQETWMCSKCYGKQKNHISCRVKLM